MVPVFVNQTQSVLDEDNLRSHIESGRKVIAPKDEMADVMSQVGLGNGSGTDLGASAPRILGGALCRRREVTGKIGTLSSAVPTIAEDVELRPRSLEIGKAVGLGSRDRCQDQQPSKSEAPRASIGGWGTPGHDLEARGGNKLDDRMQTPWRWSDDGSQATTPLAKTLEEAQL